MRGARIAGRPDDRNPDTRFRQHREHVCRRAHPVVFAHQNHSGFGRVLHQFIRIRVDFAMEAEFETEPRLFRAAAG